MNIFVAKIKSSPHKFVNINDLDVKITEVDVEDLTSLVFIAYSTTYEGILVPFVWYELSTSTFKLSIEVPSGDDEEDHLLIFKYPVNYEEVISPYLEFDPKTRVVKYVEAPVDLTKKYMLIVSANKLFTL